MVLKSKTDKNQSSVETTILEVLRGPHKARGIMWSVHVRVRKGFLEKEMIDFTELLWKNKEKKKKLLVKGNRMCKGSDVKRSSSCETGESAPPPSSARLNYSAHSTPEVGGVPRG